MSLFSNPTDFNNYGPVLAELLFTGGSQLEKLAKEKQQIRYQEWSNAMRNATAGSKTSPTDEQLAWLWEALTTEPRIARELGSQIMSLEEEWKRKEAVPVLNSGHVLGVFLKPFSSYGGPVLSVPPEVRPDGWITLVSVMIMGPGKARSRRFECKDVTAMVEIRVAKPGSPAQESILMKLEPKDIDVKDGTVTASVRSLNHAFTVTSRRLQPTRRSDGGRIYDHIALRENAQWVPLEDIRREVEAGTWKII
jgi:hypothetical protein